MYISLLAFIWQGHILRILSRITKQHFSILRHLVGEISPVEFYDYRVNLTGACDLKHFVGSVNAQWSMPVSNLNDDDSKMQAYNRIPT